MLMLSAGAMLLLTDQLWAGVRQGDLPIWAAIIAPTAFTVFAIIYAIDRWLLVRRRHYPLARAFFQVAFAVLFLAVLVRPQALEYRQAKEDAAHPNATVNLLKHREPGVRGATCELLGLRGDLTAYAEIEGLILRDTSAHVRERCTRALEQLRAIGAQTPKTRRP